ncbi:rho GTPase-activating protein 26-like [Dendroctonus ponderosae]|nr:rho GTPase-activating protein 26-like [Dendroctonus ponderosae]
MSEVQKQEVPPSISKGCKEGYLFLLEKKAFGTTWTKHYCKYDKETKEFTLLPYNQLTTKSLPQPEKMVLTACIRRKSESIDKRFCFDIHADSKPGVIYTLQALSEQDRTAWMDIMDGKEPTYTAPTNKIPNSNEESYDLDDVGRHFVKRCIEVLEKRGLEEQGIYRVVGVTSKVNKLLTMGLDRRKADKVALDDPQEWETKTITTALKTYLRNLPEPLMSFKHHNDFINAVKRESRQNRVHEVHKLLYKLPKTNLEVLSILIKHLTK